jgi:hypothetical protein
MWKKIKLILKLLPVVGEFMTVIKTTRNKDAAWWSLHISSLMDDILECFHDTDAIGSDDYKAARKALRG